MEINRIPVARSSMPPFEEFAAEIKSLWNTRWLSNYGEKHNQLQEKLKSYLDASFINLYSNGHQALEAAFQIFPKGSEVITTPFTYASTTQAIVHSGLIPVFCDIEPEFYTLDPLKVETLITEKTVAIAAVHVYGNLCNHDALQYLAKKHGLQLIYDAAHAFGVRKDGHGIGFFGDMIMLSFHATKVFHTFEGGALICKSAALAERTKAWAHFGMYGNEDAEIIGTNAKMNEIQAAMGLCNLRHIESALAIRRACVEHYKKRLQGIEGIHLCSPQLDVIPNGAYMPIQIDPAEFGADREATVQLLERNGISTRKYFYPLTSAFSVYRGLFKTGDTPVAEKTSAQIICLPLYTELTKDQIDTICNSLICIHCGKINTNRPL